MSTFAAFINGGSAYVVNDIYRKYINDSADDKTYMKLSYIVTASIVVVGVGFGLAGGNIQARTDWIVGLLYGSYVASNVLKWVWWRFNGYGFFFGMFSGMVGVAVIPPVMEAMGYQLLAIEQFPILFAFALVGSIAGCLLTKPEDEEVLKKFYSQTRPWGFWKPIAEKVMAEDPSFKVNNDFGRDMFNIVVGIIWQMTLVVIPVFLVIREYTGLGIGIAVFILCTVVLKKFWWNRLED
jgi:Na+/proline symporter